MHPLFPRLALVLAGACLVAGSALAQRERYDRPQHPRQSSMSQDQRQRMREDMREVYRERSTERTRPERPRSLTPEERERLRQDVQNANKAMRR